RDRNVTGVQTCALPIFGRVLTEGHRPGLRVEPVPLRDLRLFEREPPLCSLLGRERRRSRPHTPVRTAIADLKASRGQGTDVAEDPRLLARHQATLPRRRRTGSTVPAVMNSSRADSGMRT